MSRILVTGGTGFLGRHLVAKLKAKGHEVRVLARSEKSARKVLPPRVDVIEGDVASREACARAIDGCEIVYHLAAAYQEPGIVNSRYYDVHVGGTQNLLTLSKKAGIERFVHCSTVGVLSHIANPPADESWPHQPGDIYQQTKSWAEQLALRFHQEHDFPLTVARPTPIYGPGDMRLFKLFKMIGERRFVMLGSGEVFYHMIYVDDLVKGLRVLAEHPAAIGEVFTLGGPEYCSLNDLVGAIAEQMNVDPPSVRLPAWPVQMLGSVVERICIPMGVKPPIFRRRVDFFTKSRAFSIDKARKVVGFEASTSLTQGIAETIAWYRDNDLLPKRATAVKAVG